MERAVVLSITGRCNYHCRHCSVSAPAATMGEMTLEQVRDVLRQIKDCGIRQVTLIGGEPMIHPNFREIIEFMQDEEITLSSIFTNGSLLTAEFLDWLTDRGLKPHFRISYDGYGYHDKMRGVPGAEARLYKTLELLKKKGFCVVCDMSICKENLPTLMATLEKAAQYGVQVLTVYPPQECGNWLYVDKGEKLAFKDMLEYYLGFIPEFLKKNLPISLNIYSLCYFERWLGGFSMMYSTATTGDKMFQTRACRSYENEINISAAGYLSPCYVMMDSDYVKENMPNVFCQPLKEILEDSAYQQVTDLTVGDIVSMNEACRDCQYRTICGGGCRGMALFATGDITTRAPMYCEFFQSGGYEKLKKTVLRAYANIYADRLFQSSKKDE